MILASPVSQPWSFRHSASSSGPAASWIAPSTPPPPSSDEFAALTMASTRKRGDVGNNDFQPRLADLARETAQAEAAALTVTPLSANSCCNSPAWNISRMMSQPPTNSPLT